MARTRYAVVIGAVMALAAVSIVQFMGGSEAATPDDRESLAAAMEKVSQEPPPAVTLDADPAGVVPWDRPLVVRVANGTLSEVSVVSAEGQAIPGDLTPEGAWQSSGTLVPQTAYTVQVSAVGADQRLAEQSLTVTASAPTTFLKAILSPAEGEVVGIGMPAVVTLNRPVAKADRPAVEQRFAVTTNPPVEGDWRWITPTRVHWRPATYWQPGTEVSVRGNLQGVRIADHWGEDLERTVSFRIGDAQVSTVDVAAHQMTVTKNGVVERVIAISAGRAKWPTHNGVHLALEKNRTVTMDSSTVGIPRNSPGGYYRKVAWAIRMSWSGTFTHAAPWSVGSQGRTNVSHGCINMSTANAQWFFNFTRRGDPIEVVNSPAKPKLYDPGMADWNVPWEQWTTTDVAV
jgi:lipoprotein-anchoring transpeptidase ErfK/SrfK